MHGNADFAQSITDITMKRPEPDNKECIHERIHEIERKIEEKRTGRRFEVDGPRIWLRDARNTRLSKGMNAKDTEEIWLTQTMVKDGRHKIVSAQNVS